MSEWKEYKFSDFVDINPLVKLPKGKSISYVEMKDLDANRRWCTSVQDRTLTGGSRFQNNDTLFARISPCFENGKICQVKDLNEGVGYGSTEFHVMRGKQGVSDSTFVFYLCRWEDVKAHAFLHLEGTSGRQRVPKEAFDSLFLTLPPLEEQRRIAGVLSSLDDKIDLLNRENATLEALAETLFRHYFIENPDPTWKEGNLGDVVDVKSGFAFKGSSFVERGKYKLVTIKAVQDGFLSLENSDCITEVPSNVKDYCYLKKGDILLSLTGNVGRCCLVDSDGLLLNQRVALLVAKDKRNWPFVYTFFRLQSTKSLLEEMAKGTAQPNLSPVELAKMSFFIPPQNILEQFGREASPIIEKVLSNRQQIQILSTLRDTLLPRLMSGVVKVSWQ